MKGSALPPRGVKQSLLESAELRGVVLAAAASVCDVRISKRSTVSRTFGERNADDYLQDDAFWGEEIDGLVNKASREAALIVLAEVRGRRGRE